MKTPCTGKRADLRNLILAAAMMGSAAWTSPVASAQTCGAAGASCTSSICCPGDGGGQCVVGPNECLDMAGASCTSSSQCISDACSTTCEASSYGSGCSTTADCPSGDECIWTKDVCLQAEGQDCINEPDHIPPLVILCGSENCLSNTCETVGVGGQCGSTNDCYPAVGLECSLCSNACLYQVGYSCPEGASQCGSNSCVGGTCAKVGAGDSCVSNSDCSSGLICGVNLNWGCPSASRCIATGTGACPGGDAECGSDNCVSGSCVKNGTGGRCQQGTDCTSGSCTISTIPTGNLIGTCAA
jgi:hypothetical protein